MTAQATAAPPSSRYPKHGPVMLCRVMGEPDDWYPDDYRDASGEYTEEAEHAIGVCNMCPFRKTCLENQLAVEGTKPEDHRFGIFGGADPKDRFAMSMVRSGGKLRRRRSGAPLKDADQARALLIQHKKTAGDVSVAVAVATATGMTPETVQMILTGRRAQIRPSTERRLLAYYGVAPGE